MNFINLLKEVIKLSKFDPLRQENLDCNIVDGKSIEKFFTGRYDLEAMGEGLYFEDVRDLLLKLEDGAKSSEIASVFDEYLNSPRGKAIGTNDVAVVASNSSEEYVIVRENNIWRICKWKNYKK